MQDYNIFILIITWTMCKMWDHVECEYFADSIY